MRAAVISYLPWVLSAITIWMNLMAGNKHKGAWTVGLVAQALWLVWIVSSQAWGLIPLNLALWWVYWRNHVKWREHVEPSRRQVYDAADDGDGPYMLWARVSGADDSDARKAAVRRFSAWAEDHLGVGYSMACSGGSFVDPVTHWACKAYLAALGRT